MKSVRHLALNEPVSLFTLSTFLSKKAQICLEIMQLPHETIKNISGIGLIAQMSSIISPLRLNGEESDTFLGRGPALSCLQ